MKNLKIMVVDDSALTIKRLEAMLEQLGHQVARTCQSGVAAVEAVRDMIALEQQLPDMVTMDITMPEMDGISATRHLLELAPDILIIMVTSHGQEQMVIEAIEAGAKGYVLKPFKVEKLQETISNVVTHYRKVP